MKRALNWISGIVLTPIILVSLLIVAFYLPPVQNWAVQKIAIYASEKSNMEITLKSVRISPLLDIDLQDLLIRESNHKILQVKHALVDLDFTHILEGKLGVEAVDLEDGSMNTHQLIARMVLKGDLQNLHLNADDVNLKEHHVMLNGARLDGCNLDIVMRDTTIIDTTKSVPVNWGLDIHNVQITDSRLTLHMPGDTIMVQGNIKEALLEDGNVSLERGIYQAKHLMLKADSLNYDMTYKPAIKGGLDYNHIRLSNVDIDVQNAQFCTNGNCMKAVINRCQLKESCGLEIDKLVADVFTDSTSIKVKGLDIITPNSTACGDINFNWNAFTPGEKGSMSMNLRASLGQSDVLCTAGSFLSNEIRRLYPNRPILLDVNIDGNIDRMDISDSRVTLPTIIDIRTRGTVDHITDQPHSYVDLKWDIHTMDLSSVRRYLGLKGVSLPPMNLTAGTQIRGYTKIAADALLTERKGRLHLKGKVDLNAMTYDARLKATQLQIHDFLPNDSIYHLTADTRFHGHGTDFLSNRTVFEGQVKVNRLQYGHWNLDSIDVDAKVRHGMAKLNVSSDNELLRMQACADATLHNRRLNASTFNLDMSHIDLYAFRVSKNPLTASMVMHLEGSSDFRQTHHLGGSVEAMELVLSDTIYHPVDLTLNADLTPQSIKAKALAGDLLFNVQSDQGLDSLLTRCYAFTDELKQQVDSLYIQQDALRSLLPHLQLKLICGRMNPVSNLLRSTLNYTFNDLNFDLDAHPDKGLFGIGQLHGLNTGAILLDSISWNVYQDQSGVSIDGKVKNGPKNKVVVFESDLHADITPTGAKLGLEFIDAKGKKGVDLGVQVDMLKDGILAHLTPLNPIIAYRKFTINEDNFVQLKRDNRLEALVDLLADDGTGLKLYSTPNEEALQDISLSVNHFNLGELTQVLPYMPDIQGFLHGDLHYMQTDSTTTISTDMAVQDMIYEGTDLGNIGLNGAYFPNEDGSHYVDGILTRNDIDILYLNGKYWEEDGDGYINGNATLNHTPFNLADAFIPQHMARLEGYAMGDLSITGQTSNPIFTGELTTDSFRIISDDYNISLQIPNDTLVIDRSYIALNKINAYAAGKTPLTLDGDVNFRNMDKVSINLSVAAKNYELINSPKNKNSLAYGKVFVDMSGRMWGTLDDLKMRGKLAVLGNTDVTYVLKDSPITVEDQLSDLVTFCDFSDTTETTPVQVANQSIDMQMNISIEQAAQMHCLLNEDGSDFIDLQGGGDLNMTYDLQNDMRLYGRYTIQQGTMRYSLMAIPLNDFSIENGSFVEFTGELMNPRLSIKASERVKASVTENKVPRNVTFDVGLSLSQSLENMGLEFTLEAPEDLATQNQLTAMSLEDRGRVAVTMLVTGMYMTDDFDIKGGFSYANTLNTYLQSAINKIAGQALGTIDLNFGIENSTTETGSNTTDYSFSFAKRFWGNRISIIVGGKVSTGKDAVNTGQTIIDNVSLEYRLDNSSTRYVRLYYDRNYESLLEGEIMEMGAGLVLRKKIEKLGDLFIFRKQKKQKASL